MPNINQLSSINLRDLIERNTQQKTKSADEARGQDFSETVSDFLKAVNDSQKESGQKVSEVIQGKSDNLHEAMASMEEAKLSFQLMIEVRNKLMESYQELQRLQV